MAHDDAPWLRRLVRQDLARLGRGPFASVDVVADAVAHTSPVRGAPAGRTAVDRVLARVDAVRPEEAPALLAVMRPGIRLLDDRLHLLPPYWQHLVGDRNRLARAARVTGVLLLRRGGREVPVGTGFLVRPGLVLTARHVAEQFVQGVGVRDLALRPATRAVLRLAPGEDVEIAAPLLVHPYWDVAVLAPRAIPLDRVPLSLAEEPPRPLVGREVAVIGFPIPGIEDEDETRALVGKHLGDKHVQPGQLTGVSVVDSRWEPVPALRADALTLPGNSGSPVLDLEEGRVLGVHFARERPRGGASVPAWELARDPHLRALGLFGEVERQPGWLAHWGRVDQPPRQARDRHATATPVHLPGDWVERVDDAFVARMLDADPAGTRALLRAAWGDAIAEELIAELGREPSGEARLGWPPRPDPELPEIVFLHGIIGGHLDDGPDRVWLDPAGAIARDLSRRLSLAPDGERDLDPDVTIRPAGHIQLIYGLAALRWRHAGFSVQQLSFDFRRNLDHAVRQLDRFLRARRRAHPKRSFALVGHSMGGLVALMYGARHPARWASWIDAAVLLGSPVAGALPAFESPTGTYRYLLTMAALSNVETRGSLAGMVRTWPGSHDMLPAPEVFPGCADLYDAKRWPVGTAPDQGWLDRSRMLKPVLLERAADEKVHLVAGLGYPTHVDVARSEDGRVRVTPRREAGDDSVPLRSAIPPGCRGWVVQGLKHAYLPLVPSIIRAVPELVLEGGCRLRAVSEDDRAVAYPDEPRPDPVHPDRVDVDPVELVADRDRLADIRRRMERGDVGLPDLLALAHTTLG